MDGGKTQQQIIFNEIKIKLDLILIFLLYLKSNNTWKR